MSEVIKEGDCVKIPDGRTARVREIAADRIKVRVQRISSKTHQFLYFPKAVLKRVSCPKGWMSPEGYNRYLKLTMDKMKERLEKGKNERR